MQNIPKIKLIAADMDGTLLNNQGKISEYNLKMIKKAQENGIVFAISTGRFPENAAQIALDAGLECPVISLNGAVIELSPNRERIHEVFLEKEAAKKVFDCLEELNEGYYMFGRAAVNSRRDYPRHISEADPEALKTLKKRVKYAYGYEACKAALDEPQYKFFIYHSKDGHPLKEVYDALNQINDIDITASSDINLEVMPRNANKGLGLKVLADILGIDMENTMALGDQMNDLQMIEEAGLGIAMANATERVKSSADAVTDHCNDDGVGKAIAKYCFQEEGQQV
ncbi:MAG: Cof-type HAD-IIB family hydrolase [Bacillota bacterium]|nr:Cof-type HAD-IIB family hydrolase [Bacillota bacterium]